MSLERYRVPDSVRTGVWLELPDAPGARFRVRLPSRANREWQREVLKQMAASGMKVTAEGELDESAVDAQEMVNWAERRLIAFQRLCIVEGPPGFELDSLLDDYWPALGALFNLAAQQAAQEAAAADEAVGELSA